MFVCRRTVGHPIRISGRRMLIQTQGKVKSFCIFLYMPSIYHSEQINIQTLPFKCLVLVRFFWVKLWCFFLDSFMNRNSEEQHRFQTEFLYKYKLVLSLLIILSIYIYIYIYKYIHHSRILVFIYVLRCLFCSLRLFIWHELVFFVISLKTEKRERLLSI